MESVRNRHPLPGGDLAWSDWWSLHSPSSWRPVPGSTTKGWPSWRYSSPRSSWSLNSCIGKYATKSYQLLAIHVKPRLNIIGLYIPPNTERIATHECLSRLKSLYHGPTVIVGDWNAIQLDWDEKANKKGWVVRNWVLQWNLTLRAAVTAPTYLTPFSRSAADFYLSSGV